MKKIILGVLIFAGITAYAQKEELRDPKAKAILEQLSTKNKAHKTISAEFEYHLENKDAGIDETQKGSLLLMGDNYILNMAGQEIYNNGKYLWRYMPDVGEVNKDCAPTPEEEGDNLMNPNNIFTIYEKGFKYQYVNQETIDGKQVDVVKLFPENANDKSYHTIVLNIDKAKQEIHSMVVKAKDGNVYTTKLTKFEPNVPANVSDFTFDESKADDVIDLCD